MVRRVPEVPEIDQPHQDTNYGDHFGQHITEIVELAFERGLFTDLLRD